MLAGLDGAVQDEINDLKIGTGSAILRPHNGLLAVFKPSLQLASTKRRLMSG